MFEAASELKEIIEKGRKEIREKSESVVKRCFAELFEKHPDLKAVGWSQYTPHFNDGDACTFSVNEPYYSTVDERDVGDLYGDGWNEVPWSDKDKTDATRGINALFAALDDDVLEAAFGDHALIIATAKGIDVAEYDHD